jgi:photosystem II stability/assembly factor-like uncharacterized protein
VAPEFDAPKTSDWQAVGWGGGGYYWACAFDPAVDGTLYLGGDVNGVYKSTDHGKSFRIVNHGLGHYAVYSLHADASRSGTVYAGTTGGLYISRDHAESWTFLPETAKGRLGITAERNQSVRTIATDSSGVVYAGTVRGELFRSDDSGTTWRPLELGAGPASVAAVAVSASDPRLILVATAAGLRRSTDGGASFAAPDGPVQIHGVAIHPKDDRVAYAACAKDGVFRSNDRGATWSKRSGGIDAKFNMREVVIDPDDPERVVAIGTESWNGIFYASSNGGIDWTPTQTLKTDPVGNPTNASPEDRVSISFSAVTNLAMNPKRPTELYIAGNWRNAYSSDGGKSFEERERGADITVATDIQFVGTTTYVTAMDEGLLATSDGGATWRQLVPLRYTAGLSGHHWRVRVLPLGGGKQRIVATSSPWDASVNQILVSDDDGATFQQVRAGLPEKRPTKNTMWGEGYARALAVDPADPLRLYLGIDGDPDGTFEGGGVFGSSDGGFTWQRLGQPASRRMFYGLVVDPTDSKRLFWGAAGGQGGVHRSTDGGASWAHVFAEETWIFNVEISPSGTVYASGKNLWRSRDHGETFSKITSFSEDLSIVGIALDPRDEQRVFISRVSWGEGASGGVYETTDGGASWKDITLDIPNRKPLVLRYDAERSELWAGGTGLYRIAR